MKYSTDYKIIEEEFINLINSFNEEDKEYILRAFDLAKTNHFGQKRDEGSPYIIHPLRITMFLIDDLKIRNKTVLAAALLHDTIEDTDLTVKQIQQEFGETVANMVFALTRDKNQETKREKFVKTLHANESIRIIKSCDWLDNLRSWEFIPTDNPAREKFPRWFSEAETMYIPLAKTVNQYIVDEMLSALKRAKQS